MNKTALVLLALLFSSCAQMNKLDEDRRRRMHEMGEITEKDSSGIRRTDYDVVKPYIREESIKGKRVYVVYKAGQLRRHWAKVVGTDLGLKKEEFRKMVEKEKFNNRNFQDYIVWLPRKTDTKKLKIVQKAGSKTVAPFYVEPMDGEDPTLLSFFPFATKEVFPVLIRFRRKGRKIPSLYVELGAGRAAHFHWRRPKALKSQ